jgi:hypothetical protein
MARSVKRIPHFLAQVVWKDVGTSQVGKPGFFICTINKNPQTKRANVWGHTGREGFG